MSAMDRRQFLKASGILAVAGSGIGGHLLSADPRDDRGTGVSASKRRWAMGIDLTKCLTECDACMTACRRENNVAFFGDERIDVHWIRKAFVKNEQAPNAPETPVLLLCNHCDRPPCAAVCPVQATYKREDGIVIVDPHRCMGCRYCMVACPYDARFFNYKENPSRTNKKLPKRSHGVAESCNFCAHRIDVKKAPACVEACPTKAMIFGDLNDPDSEVSRFAAALSVQRIREDLGTEPKVYYLGV